MQETKKFKSDENHFQKLYIELNEVKKKLLRLKFNSEFDYKSSNSFYTKLNGTSPMWKHEKEFIAKELKTTVKKLEGKK